MTRSAVTAFRARLYSGLKTVIHYKFKIMNDCARKKML